MHRALRRLIGIGAALALAASAPGPAHAAEDEASPAASPSVTAAPLSALGGDQLALPGRQLNRTPEVTRLPKIAAKSWLIADLTTGEVLAAKNAHLPLPPASTLKTLTALTVLPRLPLDTPTKATRKAVTVDGTRVGLVEGRTYTVDELMYALFLPSANDAAVALAQANGGVPQTVAQMNQMARSLQANDTVAKNPSGLDRPGQVSSAYDLALMARAGLARPDFAAYAATKSFEFPDKGKRTRTIYSENRLLTGGYRGAVGVKMGFTSQAGRTFVAAATRKGHTLAFVGMRIVSRSSDAARTALDWGFANLGSITPVGMLVDPLPESAPTLAAVPDEIETPVDLSAAGLDVPVPDDPMAPWWFWVLLLGALAGAVFGRRLWRGRRRRPAMGMESSSTIRVDYHPYDPR